MNIKTTLIAAVAVAMMSAASMASAEEATTKTGVYVGTGFSLATSDEDGIENQKGFNFNVGYDFGLLRVEGAYDRLSDDDLQSSMFSGMGYFDFDNSSKFTPFIGAGLGWSDLSDVNAGANNSDVTYIGSAGASYDLSNKWDLVGQYRYLMSSTEVLSDTGNTDTDSQIFTVGLRTTF